MQVTAQSTQPAVTDTVTAFLHRVPTAGWVGLLAAGVLLLLLTRRRSPVLRTRKAFGAGVARTVWRFGTGAHLDGKTRSDAGWWSRGHKDLSVTGKAPRWAFLPRGVRALIRWGCLLATVLLGWAWAAGSAAPLVPVLLALGALMVWAAVAVPRKLRTSRHRARYVMPLHKALWKLVGWAESTRAEEWVSVPRDFRSEGATIRLLLPDGFPDTPQIRQGINNAVSNNLGLPLYELDTVYDVSGPHKHVTFTSVDAADKYLRVVNFDQAHEGGTWRNEAI